MGLSVARKIARELLADAFGGAFELEALPNRAELRLKSTDTVIGYTLSLVRNDDGETVGAA